MSNIIQSARSYVTEFMQATSGSTDPRIYVKLMREEFGELKEAMEGDDRAHQLKELADLILVTVSMMLVTPEEIENLIPEAEFKSITELFAEIDDFMPAYEATTETNVFAEVLYRVHRSNMSKILDDGTVLRRADGKIMKGPNYKVPDLSDLV